MNDTSTSVASPVDSIVGAVGALWLQSEGRRIGAELQAAGYPVMVLKGPDLQQRLFGTPAAYVSSDVDLLVRRRDAPDVRKHLVDTGWSPVSANSVLWPLSAEATFEREGMPLDLHWGIHAGHVPSQPFRHLEAELWRGAATGPSGLLEPRIEPLTVYLAVHAAGHAFVRPEWRECVLAAARLVEDWNEVWRIAVASRVTNALGAALSGSPAHDVLDGFIGRATSGLWWLARGRFVPSPVRSWIREERSLLSEGFGMRAKPVGTVAVGDRTIVQWRGVCGPGTWTPALVDAWLEAVDGVSSPTLVELGVGTGVLSFMAAEQRADARVVGVDISLRAIRNARENARQLGSTNVTLLLGDLLQPLPGSSRGHVDAILAHLPSVPSNAAARTEEPITIPRSTLVGPNPDGLGLIRRLLDESREWLRPGGSLVVSMQTWQWRSLEDRALALGYEAATVVNPVETGAVVRLTWSGAP